MTLTRSGWAKAARELVDAAGVRSVALAKALDIHPTLLCRYWSGERKPSPTVATKLNVALAAEIGNSEVRGYLDAVWALEHLDDDVLGCSSDDDRLDLAARILTVMVASLDRVLQPGCEWKIVDAILERPPAQTRKILRSLNMALRTRLLRGVTGRPAGRSFALETLDIFARNDVAFSEWLRPRDDLRRVLLEDAFARVVCEVLSETGADIQSRNKWEARIMGAYTEIRVADELRTATPQTIDLARLPEAMSQNSWRLGLHG